MYGPDLIERIEKQLTRFADWAKAYPDAAVTFVIFAVCALLVLTLFMGKAAYALDPACDPADPGYAPHVGTDYVRPDGTVHFCTSLDDPTAGRDIDETKPFDCLLELDGRPYAVANVAPGQEVLLIVDDEDRVATHQAVLTCTAFMVAIDGSTHLRVSDQAVVTFDPVPVPEAPVPLP